MSAVAGLELQREDAGERGQHCIELQAARLPRDLSKGDRATRTARIERPEGGETSEGWRKTTL
jgi:hypothetical protein